MLQSVNFSLANIVAGFIFGAIGLGAFIYGKKMALVRPMAIGIVLMMYPYFFQGRCSSILSASPLLPYSISGESNSKTGG